MFKFFRENKYVIWFIGAFLAVHIYVIIGLVCGFPKNDTNAIAVLGAFWILIFIGMFFLWKKMRSKKETRENARIVLSIGIFLLVTLIIVFTALTAQG